ncbi:MAG: YbaN family protein [Bosea sp. (in: a-proteobacteria)]|uniref:YbaN family protein n=1 Tax=Bosea sp. (in: a-proteobacteria) TaxID=1871050 RepID=UPI0027325774|nr:YbaN family protein [Bosea sp. (in: a-proteobacteria)]MDP3257314.1 YbaN family protein [Bosea sp. (in: a-proteobacteria)]MDP3320889.1 YbaN family protein [Bosea sp. (in: a-proteobacteria)]
MTRRTHRFRRPLLFAAGSILTVLGAIGMVLPLMPGTIFLIMAAWCFAQSSPRFEAWLLGHPRLGPQVRRWRDTGMIDRRVKLVACGSMLISFAILTRTSAPPIALWATGLCLLAAGLYVASRPEP